jgi:hypothetical protein
VLQTTPNAVATNVCGTTDAGELRCYEYLNDFLHEGFYRKTAYTTMQHTRSGGRYHLLFRAWAAATDAQRAHVCGGLDAFMAMLGCHLGDDGEDGEQNNRGGRNR